MRALRADPPSPPTASDAGHLSPLPGRRLLGALLAVLVVPALVCGQPAHADPGDGDPVGAPAAKGESAAPAATWILPSSARLAGAGGAFYTTGLSIANAGSSDLSFTLKFLGHDADGRGGSEKEFSLAAGRSMTIDDVLGSVFGLSDTYGAIRVGASSNSVVVASQTSTLASAGGTFGQSVPASGEADWVRAGTPRSIPAVREDSSFRTNLILANATEAPLDVDVALVAESGATLAAKRYALFPLGMTQVTRVVRDLGITASVSGGRLVLSTGTAGGAFAAYAAVIDNTTNDPRTLLPAPATPAAAGRYLQEVFPEVNVSSDLAYGSSRTWNGHVQTLLLDLYEPRGDTAAQRPAIVWIHGGGFTSGSKTAAPIVTLARRFAMRGYLCVSIDYRLRPSDQRDADPTGAILDAMYDARAAVRWLRSRESQYRIDSSRIAIGGGSAGAYTALNVAYREEEGDSGNPGYSSAVRAVVDFWGALTDVSQMEAGEAPLIIIHGTEDSTVPFGNALALDSRAGAVGVPHELHPLDGEGHSAWDLMEDFLSWITPFLYTYVIGS